MAQAVLTTTKPTPPMMDGLPIIGHALEFSKDRGALIEKGYRQHGSVFGIRLANKPVAIVIGPEFHEIFFAQTDKSLNMDKVYGFAAAMFGKVAFAASKETYIQQRPLLHLPFGRTKMLTYLKVMQEEVQMWLNTLDDEGEIEIVSAFVPLIQNIAAHALMGREFRHQMGREFWVLYQDLSKGLDFLLPPNLPLPKFKKRDQARQKMLAILKPIIANRRQNPDGYDDFLQDFINGKLKDGSNADDELIQNLITALMFAGHETTLGQAAWTIIQLLQHPGYMRTVQAELDRVLTPNSLMDPSIMSQLPHLDWAIQETSRMYPSGDLLLRYVEEAIEVGDYCIPAGWLIMVSTKVSHYLPDVFHNPYAYDPERFSPERQEDRQHRYTTIGFGGGTHKCTGMNFANNEMMIIVALFMQQFDLELRTREIAVDQSMGTNRPTETIIRYQRRTPSTNADALAEAIIGCPVPH